MIAHKYQYKDRSKAQENRIVVLPTSPQYADQMVELMCAAYNCPPEYTLSAEQFRNHVRVFPEGQFIALDAETDRVVGLTVSMRMDFNPEYPLLTRWVETTNYG